MGASGIICRVSASDKPFAVFEPILDCEFALAAAEAGFRSVHASGRDRRPQTTPPASTTPFPFRAGLTSMTGNSTGCFEIQHPDQPT